MIYLLQDVLNLSDTERFTEHDEEKKYFYTFGVSGISMSGLGGVGSGSRWVLKSLEGRWKDEVINRFIWLFLFIKALNHLFKDKEGRT
jgi:hypothetical protein